MSAVKMMTFLALAVLAVVSVSASSSSGKYHLASVKVQCQEDISCPVTADGHPSWEYGLGSGRGGNLKLSYNEEGTFNIEVQATSDKNHDVHSTVAFNDGCQEAKDLADTEKINWSGKSFSLCGFDPKTKVQPSEVLREAKLKIIHRFKLPGKNVDIIGFREVTVKFHLTLIQPPIVNVFPVPAADQSLPVCAYVDHEIIAHDALQNNFYEFEVRVKNNAAFPRSSDVGFNLEECRYRPWVNDTSAIASGVERWAKDEETYAIIKDGKFTRSNFLQDIYSTTGVTGLNVGGPYRFKVKQASVRPLVVLTTVPQIIECEVCLCKKLPSGQGSSGLNLEACRDTIAIDSTLSVQWGQYRNLIGEDVSDIGSLTPQNLVVSGGHVQVVQKPQRA